MEGLHSLLLWGHGLCAHCTAQHNRWENSSSKCLPNLILKNQRYSCLKFLPGCLWSDEPFLLPLELHQVSGLASKLQVLQPVGLPPLSHRLLRSHVCHESNLWRSHRGYSGMTNVRIILDPTLNFSPTCSCCWAVMSTLQTPRQTGEAPRKLKLSSLQWMRHRSTSQASFSHRLDHLGWIVNEGINRCFQEITDTPDHVKNYRPKLLVLAGNPAHRYNHPHYI